MMDYQSNPDLFIEKANILKALAHPQRLCIVKTLCEKDCVSVTDMQNCLGEVQSTVSQHLTKLKAVNIIVGKREGTTILYSIYDQETRSKVRAILREFFPEAEQ